MPARTERQRRIEPELRRIVARLTEVGAKKIVLFGSAARNDLGSTSDIDLLVVQETNQPFLRRIEEALRLVAPRVATDIIVHTPAELDALNQSNSFVRRALAEGKVLHEAKS